MALLRELAMVCLTAVSGSGAHGNLQVPATRSRGNAMGGAATPGLFPEGRCTVPPGRMSPVAREGTIGNRELPAYGRERRPGRQERQNRGSRRVPALLRLGRWQESGHEAV